MKQGPRAKRIAQRDAAAELDTECEKFVRSKMRPELVATAKKAVVAFNNEDRGKPATRR